MFHFREKIEKFCSFCAINLLYAKIQSRDGHAVVMCSIIIPSHFLWKIVRAWSRGSHVHYHHALSFIVQNFCLQKKKLYTGEKKYILYHRKNGTTALKEYPEIIMRHCNIQKDQQTYSINTQYQYSISNSIDSNCNFVLQASVESVINTSRILRQPQCKVIKSLWPWKFAFDLQIIFRKIKFKILKGQQ